MTVSICKIHEFAAAAADCYQSTPSQLAGTYGMQSLRQKAAVVVIQHELCVYKVVAYEASSRLGSVEATFASMISNPRDKLLGCRDLQLTVHISFQIPRCSQSIPKFLAILCRALCKVYSISCEPVARNQDFLGLQAKRDCGGLRKQQIETQWELAALVPCFEEI